MMKSNDYKNFAELQSNENKNNYEIECIWRNNKISIVAPHGGTIELKTTEIAKLIAGDSFNYYSFIGRRKKDRTGTKKNLHITSHKFDEPIALKLVGKSEIVIAIHGCKDKHSKKDDSKEIFIGGLDSKLSEILKNALTEALLPVGFLKKFAGTEKNNICNKGSRRKGVQFELTKTFRKDAELCGKFITAVSKCLKTL